MNEQLEATIMLAYRTIPSELVFITKLHNLVRRLGTDLGNYCEVKKVSSAHLILDHSEDFFMIKVQNRWFLVTEIHQSFFCGTEKIPNAIYIDHTGIYAYVVGEFNDFFEEGKEVPPL